MASVIDASSGQATEIPDAHLADAWKAGRVTLDPAAKYTVRRPDGGYATVPAASLKAALDAGYTTASPDEAKAEGEAKRFYGLKGQAIAAGGGALEQGTLGISSALLAGTSAGDSIQRAQAQHPYATMAGQAAGAIALTAATGLGGAVETAAGEGAAALGLRGVTARALIQGARGVAEGAQFGTAQAISDAAFDDHKLTAEQILSTIGTNAMWGGALGGAFGAGEGAIHKALAGGARRAAEGALEAGTTAADTFADNPLETSALQKAINSKGVSDEDVGRVATRSLGIDTPAEGLGGKVRAWLTDRYAQVSGALTGKDPEAINNLIANRADLLETDATRDAAARSLQEHGDALIGAQENLHEVWDRGPKRSYVDEALKDVDTDTAAQSARLTVDRMMGAVNGMQKDADYFGNSKFIRSQAKLLGQTSKALEAAIELGDKGEMFALVDDMKRNLGKDTSSANEVLRRGGSKDALAVQQNRNLADSLKQMYETARTSLEDETTWGPMGASQKAVNADYSTLIDARARFNKSFVTDIGRSELDPWNKAYGMDPGKVGSYVRNLLDPEKDIAHQAVKDYLDASRRLAKTFSDTLDLPADKLESVRKVAEATDGFHGALQDAAKSLSLVNQFEHVKDVTSGHASTFAAVAGAVLGGVPGATVGAGLGKAASLFTRPADAIMQLARIERMAGSVDSRIKGGLSGFQRGAKRAGTPPDVASYARKSAQVARITSQPDTLATRIGSNVGDMRARAPKLADAVTQTALAGLALLRDKLPPAPPGDPLDPKAKPPIPPPGVREQWLRYYDAVQDPLSVVDSLRDGRLSPEGIEVLQAVYPSLYGRVQSHFADMMASGKMKDLDHQQRIGLGLLLRLPTDPTLDPAYIAQRQAAYAMAAQAMGQDADNGGSKAAPKRPVNLEKSSAQTTVDRIEARNSQGG